MSSFCTISLDAPLRELLVLQSKGKLRRAWKRLSSPRRAIPTLLVGFLLLAYVVQVYVAIYLNDFDTTFPIRAAAPLGMLGILGLKLVGICIDRKKSGAGFRHEEIHCLLGGPFTHQQVRLYRVAGHAISIFFTSLFAAVFFRFHVPSLGAALSGAFLAMMFTYLVYTCVAVVAVNASEPVYRRGRNVGCGFALCLLGYLLYRVALLDVSNLAFLQAFGDEAITLSQHPTGRVLMFPFTIFTNMICAESVREWATWLGPGLLLNYVALQLLLRFEVICEERAKRREREQFSATRTSLNRPSSSRTLRTGSLARPVWWLGGAGPIVWRQVRALMRLKGGLGWLLIPLASAFALGGFLAYDPEVGAFQTIAVIVVLTSVFLPGLLPFDFRGDLRGLAALKMMPLKPRSVVIGQLVVPVVLLSGCQLFALSMLMLHDLSLIHKIITTMCFLLPTNTVIIALENLIFLLYPYRVAEFDMQATIRRVVMLMAKFCVVFFAVLLCLAAAWGVVVLSSVVKTVPALNEVMSPLWRPLMLSVQFCALCCVAAAVVWVTCWAYRRFDLSEDLPA